MMLLPAKRKPQRSGILRAPRRDFPRHRAFIRRHCCVVTLSAVIDECDGPIECAHYRTAGNAGTGIKPGDEATFPACRKHHAEQHRIGQPAFERRYGLNLAKIAAEFARLSTDILMRAEMIATGQEAEPR